MSIEQGRMDAQGFRVYIFRNDGGLIALTGDIEGTSLPRVDFPWQFVKIATLVGNSEDERDALDLIGFYGFCCFDEHPDEAGGL